MKLHFLGGADEVGASCTSIEIEGRRILVDAGIRMGAAQGSQLPNFSVLDDIGMPEAVLVTHAHTDHTGALPALESMLPAGVDVYATPATKAIARVLLSDAVKLMARRGERDGELPLYPPEAADAALGRVVDAPWLTTVPICDGALTATYIPAGHILGAAMIYIEGVRESILMTGDVSVANQLTIPGMIIPQCRPQVMVMESTYGNRQHADRAQQETALALRVAEAIESGGKVLVPAFAVGRSQEVILILARAMRRKQIPEFPVFVDGMVRSVNAVYSAFGDDLSPQVRRRVKRDEEIFYFGAISAVASPADRRRVLSGPPCCIVASSGMLVGGASSYYAEGLAGDAANLIAITGYQDEESPGRALLDLMRANAPDEARPHPQRPARARGVQGGDLFAFGTRGRGRIDGLGATPENRALAFSSTAMPRRGGPCRKPWISICPKACSCRKMAALMPWRSRGQSDAVMAGAFLERASRATDP